MIWNLLHRLGFCWWIEYTVDDEGFERTFRSCLACPRVQEWFTIGAVGLGVVSAWTDVEEEDEPVLEEQRSSAPNVLLDWIAEALPSQPPYDAFCHRGICRASECGNCSRIKRAWEALALLRKAR